MIMRRVHDKVYEWLPANRTALYRIQMHQNENEYQCWDQGGNGGWERRDPGIG